MKPRNQSLFEEHQGTSIVCAPTHGLPEMLEFGYVVIKCVPLHLDIHQFVVRVLNFGGVGKGHLEILDKRGPESLVVRINPIRQVLVDMGHHCYDRASWTIIFLLFPLPDRKSVV